MKHEGYIPFDRQKNAVVHIHPLDMYALIADTEVCREVTLKSTDSFVQRTIDSNGSPSYTEWLRIVEFDGSYYVQDTRVPVRTKVGEGIAAEAGLGKQCPTS